MLNCRALMADFNWYMSLSTGGVALIWQVSKVLISESLQISNIEVWFARTFFKEYCLGNFREISKLSLVFQKTSLIVNYIYDYNIE